MDRRGFMEGMLFPPGHFYSPLPDRDEAIAAVTRAEAGSELCPANIHIDVDILISHWRDILKYSEEFDWPEQQCSDRRFHLANEFFSYGDVLCYYSMLRRYNSRNVIEIGSGFSSAFLLDYRERFPHQCISLTCVEPNPASLKQNLRSSDLERISLYVSKVQDLPINLCDELDSGDILFIDSSHVAKTGSDVCFEIFELLPRLRQGVLVHFHDIFRGFEYPRLWAVDENRAWNEAYLLRAFLMFNHEFDIIAFNSYFANAFPTESDSGPPLWKINPGGSIWLRRAKA